MNVILKILLFSLAPFFVYPWKPFINIFAGESYDVALKHFKDGHVGAVNLAGHLVCLIFCIFGNFGMLDVLDRRLLVMMDPEAEATGIQGPRFLSSMSAVVWLGILIPTRAPATVKSSSAIIIGLAYHFAPIIPKELLEEVALAGLLFAIIGTHALSPKCEKIKLPLRKWVPKLLLAPGLYILFKKMSSTSYAGSQIENASIITVGTIGILAIISATPNPIKKVVVAGVLLCRFAFILTGVDELFYLGCGFTSSLYQGICHMVTDEEATLIAHGNEGANDELALEYAHVVYFPNIALETIYNKITRKEPFKSKDN